MILFFLTETSISFRVTGTSASSIRVFWILCWACGTFLGSFVNSAYMLCTRNLPLTYHNPETHQPYLGPTLTILSSRPYVLDDSWIFGLTTREPAGEVRVRRTLRHVDHTVSLAVYTWIDYGFRSWHERRVFSVVSERGEFLLAILTVSTNDLEGCNNVLMLANADVSETLPPPRLLTQGSRISPCWSVIISSWSLIVDEVNAER